MIVNSHPPVRLAPSFPLNGWNSRTNSRTLLIKKKKSPFVVA
jgi:hypothetical protein